MNIKFTAKDEHVELIKAMGSNNPETSNEANSIFAALVGPLAKEVIDETNVVDGLYDRLTVSEYGDRTIPLDDYHNLDNPDYVRVSMTSKPGDLSYSQLIGADDIAITTATIGAAIAMWKKYLRAGRLGHAEKGLTKLINEVRYKMKVQGIQPILDALANSTTNGYKHVIRSSTADQVILQDFNRLQTLAARVLTSNFGGTPAGIDNAARAIDTLLMSPEVVEEIRSIAYQPMNTRSGDVTTSGATSIAAPESVRESVYNSSGVPSIYGTQIVQLNELGDGQLFNTFFDTLAGAVDFPDAGFAGNETSSVTNFAGATEQIVIGISRKIGINGFLKVEIADGETDAIFNVMPDDQFKAREKKVGFWGESDCGYAAIEPRNVFGLIV